MDVDESSDKNKEEVKVKKEPSDDMDTTDAKTRKSSTQSTGEGSDEGAPLSTVAAAKQRVAKQVKFEPGVKLSRKQLAALEAARVEKLKQEFLSSPSGQFPKLDEFITAYFGPPLPKAANESAERVNPSIREGDDYQAELEEHASRSERTFLKNERRQQCEFQCSLRD